MTIGTIINAIEKFAPSTLQESWDNTGLQVGSPIAECTGVLVCLDPTPQIVDEAISLGCNLIVSHHPLFFKPVKKLTGSSLQQATAMNAIAAGISIYSTHTAADSARGGVSYALAQKLGIEPLRPLSRSKSQLAHLRVIVPTDHALKVRAALFDAGAGNIGDYECCSFNFPGEGTFRAKQGANPYVGQIGEDHVEAETAIEVVLPISSIDKVEKALLEVHPYQTPSYQFTALLNALTDEGFGIYGICEDNLTPDAFVAMVKEKLGCQGVRTNRYDNDAEIKIRRVAVCGGAGGEFIPTAIALGAQAYVTSDIRYHDFVDYRDKIVLIDAGHYDTEAPIKQVLAGVIKKSFPYIDVHVTSIDDNPIKFQ